MAAPEVMTKKQACQYLHISLATLERWMAVERLPVVKLGRRVLFRKAALDALLQAHERPARLNTPARRLSDARSRPQTWPRPTLLVKSKTGGKAILYRVFEGPRDCLHAADDPRSYGVGNLPLRLTQQSQDLLYLVGSLADSPEPLLRLSPATGHAAEILDV
jgi:excisionase family DNA binding protein